MHRSRSIVAGALSVAFLLSAPARADVMPEREPPPDDGCSCRSGAAASANGAWLLGLMLPAMVLGLRRRGAEQR